MEPEQSLPAEVAERLAIAQLCNLNARTVRPRPLPEFDPVAFTLAIGDGGATLEDLRACRDSGWDQPAYAGARAAGVSHHRIRLVASIAPADRLTAVLDQLAAYQPFWEAVAAGCQITPARVWWWRTRHAWRIGSNG